MNLVNKFKYHRAKCGLILDEHFRHYKFQPLQEFMLINDSVTVAVEVPVLLDDDDLRHYQNELGFEIPSKLNDQFLSTNFQ